jgi:glycosyltransferase involved in cell wall biosynthesis
MPKISVIVPTYNRAELLRSAVTSILNQTCQDFEIIVVDDASNDNTEEVVNRFNNKKIKYIHHEINKGEAGARNTGILNSNAAYIAFLDDDDEWLPNKLTLQFNLLESNTPKVGVVYSGYTRVDVTNKKILGQKIPIKRGDIYNDMLIQNCVGTPSTVLLRRECIEKVGLFDGNISYALDWDLWIRISKYFHFEYIEEPLVKYHIHENRLSNNPEIKARGLEDMFNKYGKDFKFTKYYRNSYLGIGVEFCYKGETKKGMKAFLESIRLNPLEIRNYFYLLLSLLGASNFKRIKKFQEKLSAYRKCRI